MTSNSNGKSYSVRPNYKDKFSVPRANEIMKEVVDVMLSSEDYREENIEDQIKVISVDIRNLLQNEYLDRYKLMVQVVIGQKQGVKLISKCFWDLDTDTMATYTFTNDSLFCVVTVYVTYIY